MYFLQIGTYQLNIYFLTQVSLCPQIGAKGVSNNLFESIVILNHRIGTKIYTFTIKLFFLWLIGVKLVKSLSIIWKKN